MMNILGCLDAPTGGRYLLDGIDVSTIDEDGLADLRNRKIGFVFQSFNLVPRTSALANVELPLGYAGVRRASAGARWPRPRWSSVGMLDRAATFPSELSGGQQQRVAIARAHRHQPGLIMADEPTGNLDSRSSEEVLGHLRGPQPAGPDGRPDHPRARRSRPALSARGTLADGRSSATSDGPSAPTASSSAQARGAERLMARETLRTALAGLAANKLRSGLTVLGMTIGVGSVIVLIAVGNGSSKAVQSSIRGSGTNTLTVMPRPAADSASEHEQLGLGLPDPGRRRSARRPDPGPRRRQRLARS